jgi:biofilm PGA synthesis lipoprotein PgaB
MAILKRAVCCFSLTAWLALGAHADNLQTPNSFTTLCYHDVVSDAAASPPLSAVRVSDLAAQLAWLQENGYHPVSLDAIIKARQGGAPLPPHAVLLTFDDGLVSTYTQVFPLLKLFRYPAVVAVVGQWLDLKPGEKVDYDGNLLSRDDFLSWDQIRRMQASGLVEIAAHTFDLHKGIVADPAGDIQPAVVTRLYLNGEYESDAAYEHRLQDDLAGVRDVIARETGHAPRVIVWPYGRSNHVSQTLAEGQNMPIGLTLEDGLTSAATPLTTIHRYLIERSYSLRGFAELMRETWPPGPARSVRIDPGTWSFANDDDLSRTLDELYRVKPSMVFIEPRRAMPHEQAALFSTSRLPVSSDVLNRIAWRIERRAGVPVYIDLPRSWLDSPELLDDLARHVSFTGLRLPLSPDSAKAQSIRAAVERWRWPMHFVYAMNALPNAEVLRNLRKGDWVALPAREVALNALPDEAKGHVILEFDVHTPSASIARQMRRLEAKGFRDFGLDALPSSMPTDINNAFSLRTEPQP